MKQAIIHVRTQEPDYSTLQEQHYDWQHFIYGNVQEIIPGDALEPFGRFVTLTHYVDANLYHDMLMRGSITDILHLVNQTPNDWYSKKQATVETATYASEFIAARTCIEQIIDLHMTLRYLGIPSRTKSYMFGDNESVVGSSDRPHSRLHKWHTALSYHCVGEAIAAGIIGFYHIKGEDNPADILSKHWSYNQIWNLLQPLLFWEGDTIDILELVQSSND